MYRVLVIHHLAGECGKQDATPRIQRLVLEEKMTESEKEKYWIKVTMIELSMRLKNKKQQLYPKHRGMQADVRTQMFPIEVLLWYRK